MIPKIGLETIGPGHPIPILIVEQGSNVSMSLGFPITQSLALERCVVLFTFKLKCVWLGDKIRCDGVHLCFYNRYDHLS
jgi:hypothetical protein